MPHTFTATFPIRFYECDPYGHVNNANYLRYATQAALEACVGGGYDPTSGPTRLMLQETGIEYLRPVEYGETLNVITRMSDWRNDDVSLEQELIIAGTGQLAAKVFSDWDFIGVDTLESAPTPNAIIRAFFPNNMPPESPAREPYPEPPPAPRGAFTGRRRVRWHHLNPLGYMDSAHILSLLEEVVMDSAEYVGWPMKRAEDFGFAYFAKQHHLVFGQPATMDDELTITTFVDDAQETQATRHYLIQMADGETVARAQTLWVFVDPATGRPTPIPPEWLADFAEQMVEA
ncbi:MAG: thioesterase family protein [Chloroflexi bacterium]|nr:thioesterase family protein [Chloroflexota bacterium]